MGNMITRKCKKLVRSVLLKKGMRRQGRASITPPPPVPCPPKMHCFFSTQIGLYIQQQGVQLPPRIEGAPAGLEYLTLVNEINWKKVSDPLELSQNSGTGEKYCIYNTNDEQIFFCFEKSSIFSRSLLGPYRSFNLHILDNFNREVVRLTRSSFFAAGSEECRIESPPGSLIGTVKRISTWMDLTFIVQRDGEEEAIELSGPGAFKQLGTDTLWKAVHCNQEIVSIEKRRIGCIMETGNEQDIMEITFNQQLDVKMKAMLLGASFLLDCFLLDTPKSPDEDTWSMLSTLFTPR